MKLSAKSFILFYTIDKIASAAVISTPISLGTSLGCTFDAAVVIVVKLV